MTQDASEEAFAAADFYEKADGGRGPNTVGAPLGQALTRVLLASIELNAANRKLDTAVEEARASGESWSAIGRVLGMTRQGANKRFS
ncbi:hypothetical protein [Actinotignum schaalii]|uniref:Uncharacterized protein n=1 Tax=Actinotignum schaalii FB123-CNA-2 TaxID=883067 RepID=S2W5P6_9ACTO|nr:hypothetical protein [Actinotignum schaalii]EPD27957.1 hypothetical protein HMPREF9237_00520 [Actinotignum schaalii FB123-CNA-2]